MCRYLADHSAGSRASCRSLQPCPPDRNANTTTTAADANAISPAVLMFIGMRLVEAPYAKKSAAIAKTAANCQKFSITHLQ